MELLKLFYKDFIVEHSSFPKHKYILKHADYKMKGFNSMCGDIMVVYVELKGSFVKKVSFTSSSCAISTASASVMTCHVSNQTITESLLLCENFKASLLGKKVVKFNQEVSLLLTIKKYPSRLKCVSLAWDILNEILKKCV